MYGGIAQLARAIGSYPAGHKFKSYCRYQIFDIWSHRQAVKTSPFHGEVSSSNLLGITTQNPTFWLGFYFVSLLKKQILSCLLIYKFNFIWFIINLILINSKLFLCLYGRYKTRRHLVLLKFFDFQVCEDLHFNWKKTSLKDVFFYYKLLLIFY